MCQKLLKFLNRCQAQKTQSTVYLSVISLKCFIDGKIVFIIQLEIVKLHKLFCKFYMIPQQKTKIKSHFHTIQLANLRFGQQQNQVEVEDESEPRFILFYAGTYTSTFTTTAFTKTTTFSIAICTPSSLSYSACG